MEVELGWNILLNFLGLIIEVKETSCFGQTDEDGACLILNIGVYALIIEIVSETLDGLERLRISSAINVCGVPSGWEGKLEVC